VVSLRPWRSLRVRRSVFIRPDLRQLLTLGRVPIGAGTVWPWSCRLSENHAHLFRLWRNHAHLFRLCPTRRASYVPRGVCQCNVHPDRRAIRQRGRRGTRAPVDVPTNRSRSGAAVEQRPHRSYLNRAGARAARERECAARRGRENRSKQTRLPTTMARERRKKPRCQDTHA
jgi:hypothetical protein